MTPTTYTRPAARPALDGRYVLPGDAGFDDARMAWNLTADQHPAAVVLPASAADVAATVRFARDNGLRVAPQGTATTRRRSRHCTTRSCSRPRRCAASRSTPPTGARASTPARCGWRPAGPPTSTGCWRSAAPHQTSASSATRSAAA